MTKYVVKHKGTGLFWAKGGPYVGNVDTIGQATVYDGIDLPTSDPELELIPVGLDGSLPTGEEGKRVGKLGPKEADGAKKIDVSLVPPSAVNEMALAMMAGLKKPGRWPFNWRNGGKVKRRTYLAAAIRHIHLDLNGEDCDDEMSVLLGRPVTHMGAALACLGIVTDAKECGSLIDDRPTTTFDKDQVR